MKFSNKVNFLYLLSSLVLFTALTLLAYFGYQYYFSGTKVKTSPVCFGGRDPYPTTKNCDYQRVLDGVCVDSADKINPKLVAVMIENHLDARPQSGLSQASVVYEAPVEANYTRFMAIYPADVEVKKVGPVRSARPYFLDWLAEYGALPYMHCGGSPDALALIKKRDIFDLNEFYNGGYYWRAENREAPHNVYTSSEMWNKVLVKQEVDNIVQDSWTGWEFNTSTLQLENNLVSKIKIDFNLKNYNVEWQFNSSTQKLERFVGGNPHLDETNRQILADNVVVIATSMKVIDEVGRLEIKTLGTGKAIVYKSGQVTTAIWQKDSLNSRTRFYNEQKQEIIFNPGKVWVEVVPDIERVSW